MKKLSEIDDDTLLTVTPKGYDGTVMDKEEFMQSSYYIDRDEVDVAIAEETFASFSLYYALECLEDDMHEDWLSNVMSAIPKDVRERIEAEINSYLDKEPTYYPGEAVDWLTEDLVTEKRVTEKHYHRINN